MHPKRLFKETETELTDLRELTDILNNEINVACAHFYYVHGMVPITETLINAFYKLRIKILEMGVKRIETLKNSNNEAVSHPDAVISLGVSQAELEEAKEDYEYFLLHKKVRES